MHSFMVLCFAAVALAAPQYNYNQPGAEAQQAGLTGGSLTGSLSGLAAGQQGFNAASQPSSGSFGQASVVPSTFVAPNSYQQSAAPAIYNKQFFIHSAPEEEALDGSGSSNSQTSLRRNLRVVIVKAPENKGLTNAALQLAKSASEDKTIVYVLNKQTDLGEFQKKLSQLQESSPNKPEVHFVKYKTPEEAAHAQQTIQSQYDSLGGPTQVLDEGVAQSESFVGSLGSGSTVDAAALQAALAGLGGNYGSVTNTYLPAAKVK